jgi:hypothetical protein
LLSVRARFELCSDCIERFSRAQPVKIGELLCRIGELP